MTEIHCPHDRLFKSVMADARVAKDFFQNYLPENIIPSIDLNTLKMENASYIDQELDLGLSDILYSVNFRESNEVAFIYLLCEHQSSVDWHMSFRIWQFIIKIWDEHIKRTKGARKKLPLVVPLVFYHGKAQYTASKEIRDIIDAPKELIDEILFKPFHLIDMHIIEDETLRQQRWSGIMSFVMKNIYARDFLRYTEKFLEMLSSLILIEGIGDTNSFSVTMLRYILETGEISHLDDFITKVRDTLPKSTGEEFMTGAEILVQRGVDQGIQIGVNQGIQIGSKLGQANMLIDLLEIKFGKLTPSYLEMVKNADLEQLSTWFKKIIHAESITLIFEVETVN